jgi:hypothetical protein
MNVIRAHDIFPRAPHVPAPDFSGLRRILACLIVPAAFCAVMCALTIVRAAGVQEHAAVRCTCTGRCIR